MRYLLLSNFLKMMISAYIGRTNDLTPELLTWAWDTYFVSKDNAGAQPMRWTTRS
jgi:hypothetical protein